ncbi:MAG: hypothetical protein ACLUO4_01455 [Christensenellales bacterium]
MGQHPGNERLLGVDCITCLNGHTLGEDFGGLYDLTHGATLAIVEPALLTYKLKNTCRGWCGLPRKYGRWRARTTARWRWKASNA